MLRAIVLAASTAFFIAAFPETSAAQVCSGDCNADGTVTVDELIVGVDIALELRALDDCRSFDAGRDGRVTVDELVSAVVVALVGCPGAPASPTATVRPACTAPLCGAGEVLHCPDAGCPGGCGVQCVTPTPTSATTSTPTSGVTDTPTRTPICAPTGTPYSGNCPVCGSYGSCFPCPTVGPNCLSIACGLCINVTPTPTSTPAVFCTPPLCGSGEVLQCPGDCPGGCGVRCVTPTPTWTPTPAPTCRPEPPIIAWLPPYTTDPDVAIKVCGLITASSSISACSEAGCATAFTPGSYCSTSCPAMCFDSRVPLAPNQTNHLTLCQLNTACPDGGCVSTTESGAPLDIVQEVATPRRTPTHTPTPPPP